MDCGRRDRSMRFGNAKLVQIRDDVACRIDASYRSLLLRIDIESSCIIGVGAKCCRKLRANGAPECGIEHIEAARGPIAQFDLHPGWGLSEGSGRGCGLDLLVWTSRPGSIVGPERQNGHQSRIGAQEFRLGGRPSWRPNHCNFLSNAS